LHRERVSIAWREALPLFARWVDADADARTALLHDIARRDPTLHAHLLHLIDVDDEAERVRFLDGVAVKDTALRHEEPTPSAALTGERIGPWRLQRPLGAGGSGQVWLAQRCDGSHEGQVALKLLHESTVDQHAQRRFAREARVLARMRHAHISRLFDVGKATLCGIERHFIALEYIEGERIDHWCERQRCTITQRITLFLQVCEAVSYAHANLVVHRDLKPSNILVQSDGEVKLLDFGVAKLLDVGEDTERFGEASELTRGGCVPFTPEYAAPEQFEGGPTSIAADVYSLGVVLFALLAGRRPYPEATTPRQLARQIVEGMPLRLVDALDHAPTAEQVAQGRGSSGAALRRTLRGDLDTILQVALKKDPAKRYPSVAAFAEDLRRYLAQRPILARADSAAYRTRMFLTRHAIGVAFVVAVLATSIAATSVLLVQAHRLKVEVTRSHSIKEFLLDAFRSAEPYSNDGKQATDVVAMLRKAASGLDARVGMDEDTRAEARFTLAEVFRSLGHYAQAHDNYRRAETAYAQLYGARSDQALQAEAGDIVNSWLQDDADGLLPRTEQLLSNIGEKPDEALQHVRLLALDSKAYATALLGDLASARADAAQTTAEVRAVVGTESYLYSHALWRQATLALDAGESRTSAHLMGEVTALDRLLGLAPTHPGFVSDLQAIVDILIDFGAYDAAEPIARTTLRMRRDALGERHRAVAEALWDTAVIASELGRADTADADFITALDIVRAELPAHARVRADIEYDYGIHLLKQARLAEASAQFAGCIDTLSDTAEHWHYRRAACAAAVAYCAAREGQAGAVATLDHAIVEARAQHSREWPMALWLRARLDNDGVASAAASLALLDEAATALDTAGRGGSRLARDIEAMRMARGAAPRAVRRESGKELIATANAIIAAAEASSAP